MRFYSLFLYLLSLMTFGLTMAIPLPHMHGLWDLVVNKDANCQSRQSIPNFLVVGGGGAPSYNEIALEKNVLYFQRTLETMGYKPEEVASILFANGNNGQATIRYINPQRQQQFKVTEIKHLKGAATISNFRRYIQKIRQKKDSKPLFIYFTGHGGKNSQDLNNNSFYMWHNQELSVKQFATILDKIPQERPIVVMMAQCFSGSFANMIYERGNPQGSIALQTRCGFFATIKSLPSVGCTPEVNEADYRDYSSSFFAGLSGRDRTGKNVASADYNKDGKISYAEAHAFAKVDEKTMDLPISTSESWLQNKVLPTQKTVILSQPISDILSTARPEQVYVVSSLIKILELDEQKPLLPNFINLKSNKVNDESQKAYLTRLEMELINIAEEKQIRTIGNKKDIAILDRLLKCESGFWRKSNT
jgi:Peptidase C13 family